MNNESIEQWKKTGYTCTCIYGTCIVHYYVYTRVYIDCRLDAIRYITCLSLVYLFTRVEAVVVGNGMGEDDRWTFCGER